MGGVVHQIQLYVREALGIVESSLELIERIEAADAERPGLDEDDLEEFVKRKDRLSNSRDALLTTHNGWLSLRENVKAGNFRNDADPGGVSTQLEKAMQDIRVNYDFLAGVNWRQDLSTREKMFAAYKRIESKVKAITKVLYDLMQQTVADTRLPPSAEFPPPPLPPKTLSNQHQASATSKPGPPPAPAMMPPLPLRTIPAKLSNWKDPAQSLPVQDTILCQGAIFLQQRANSTIADISTKSGDAFRCNHCHLKLPPKSGREGQGAYSSDAWLLLGRSHIMACSSYTNLFAWYVCLACQAIDAPQQAFSSEELFLKHRAEPHGKIDRI